MEHELHQLAQAIKRRNAADAEIGRIIGRPPEKGHIGEFIASRIFGIELETSAAHKGSDGHFANGLLRGRSVNIKFYGKQEGVLDINLAALPDYFLVLTGPQSSAASSRGGQRPIVIESVFLFDAQQLLASLRGRGVKIGVATSVARRHWEQAGIHPSRRGTPLQLTDEQHALLAAFSERAIGPEQTA